MKSKGKIRLFKVALLVVIAVCLIPVVRAGCLSLQHQKEQRHLKESLLAEKDTEAGENAGMELKEQESGQTAPSGTEDVSAGTKAGDGGGAADQAAAPVMLERFEKLYEENSDLAAWLSIEGMVIDYPVMQCEDDEYYLHHDFYGKESKYGCLYVRNTADINTPGTNFIIYGHNMKDGSMFGDLDLYQKESFYQEHPVISFDTLYEERSYEIVAVFKSRVYNVDDDVFKYYQFYQADTREEFDYFYENIKELSLYDTGVTAEFGDTFLTLSTCAYHVEDGRFVIVAKRIGQQTE